MKLDINLYQVSLRPVREKITSGRFLLALFIVIVLAVVIRGGYEYAAMQLSQQQAQQTARLAQLQEQKNTLQSQLAGQQPSSHLLQQVAQVELDIAAGRAVLSEFEQKGAVYRDNLSPILQELAAIRLEGVWLTRMKVQANTKVELEGHALDAALLPRWMAGFAQTRTLAPYKFSVVALRRDHQDYVTFALTNEQELMKQEK